MELSEFYITKFRLVASIAAEYELRLRLLANSTKELEKYRFDRLCELENKFIAHFKNILNQVEQNNLSKYRQVRNKLLHVEFKKMMELMLEIRPNDINKENRVKSGNIDKDKDIWEQISQGMHSATSIDQQNEQDIYGWLCQVSINGALDAVEKSMLEAIQIISRCRDHKIETEHTTSHC